MIAVKNIARRLGDDICEAKPILDSRLPDGSRVAAVIPPCSLNGVTLTIRKFNSRHFGIEDLVTAGTLERWLANSTRVLRLPNFVNGKYHTEHIVKAQREATQIYHLEDFRSRRTLTTTTETITL